MLEGYQILYAEVPALFASFAFIFGACIGSFLNVCIYRIPAGQSVVHPPSHCACGKRIAWYDNIPILSWLILRGRARCCGRSFSIRYPAIELLTGVLFLLCWLLAPPLVALCWMVFVSLLVVATFIDLDTMTIPDRCSVGGFLVGLILSALVPGLHAAGKFVPGGFEAFVIALQGAFIGTALVYWVMVLAELAMGRPAMGEGDVKLMGAIGAFCGWQGAVFALFGGAILGTLVYLSFLLSRGILRIVGVTPKAAPEPEPVPSESTESAVEADTADSEEDMPAGAIPFGPALAGGALLYLFYFKPYVWFYFQDISFLFLRH